MPTYEWKCPQCDTLLQLMTSINADLIAPKCPECDAEMNRLYTAPAVTFKGDGWGKDAR